MRPSVLALALAACGTPPADDPIAFCEGDVVQRYEPLSEGELQAWPDDLYTVDAPESPTGLTVHLSDPWFEAIPGLLHDALGAAEGMSGFARNGGILLRFDGEPGEIADQLEPGPDDALQVLDLSTTPPTRIPFTVQRAEDDDQVVLQPLLTLRPGARHAVVLTTDHATPDGGCVAPSPTLRAMLTGTSEDPRFARLEARYAELLDATGLSASRISAATVFTTHEETRHLAAVAQDVKQRTYDWDGPADCIEEEAWVVCERSFVAWDYRIDGVVSDTAQATWTLPVSIWLPKDLEGPAPTLLFGHGMNGRRGHGKDAARTFVPEGFVVVATDHVEHGDHPTADPNGLWGALFLGIDLTGPTIDGRALRGNFEQTAADRLQLIELLKNDPDVDGDGLDDLDTDRLAYLGVSLGGMLGPELVALSDDVGAGVFQVAGGGLVTFVTDSDYTSLIRPLFQGLLGSSAAFDRMLPVLQTVADPADPATWGAHVLRDRPGDPGAIPDVLLPVAMQDEIVPPATGRTLARAMHLPHVAPVSLAVPTLEDAPPTPFSGNLDGVTAGYFQLDRVTSGDQVVPATHGNTPDSPEGRLQARHFLTTWLEGAPEVIDPYSELATPPLPVQNPH